ncbi:unnamed protein product [Blepharisma stoltei]|uniref:Uncharacterized protein n=1 Tax=Blepharisma stoltei TaxID=1481888 RepID=A0AAU9K261_9CILI|nr:unnamed protein product [Blepharisma stoltei]
MSSLDSQREHMLSNGKNHKIRGLLIDEEGKGEPDIDEDFEIETKLNIVHYFCIFLAVGLALCTVSATIYAWVE